MSRFNIKRRLLFVAIGAIVFFAAYSAGAAVQMTPEEAKEVRDSFSSQIEDIDDIGIFVNNVRIALGMFVPGLGIGLGVFSGYATGNVFAALAQDSPALQGIPPQLILITPFGIMEVVTYGLAMSRSGMLIYYFVKKRPWREYLVPTLIELGIAAAILLAAAGIEWWMIQELGGQNLELEGF
ncbi:stage II sporulation protein M [Nitrososphaera viennensis]|uniref:Stage II sporulation protein M n=1 Tax=Nitrososphaera viennensis TaxID=1034015 RepID=A0A977NL20_9ARCH|nr:stage II sporulation protein M [Nitrososphaera viennensis]UVS68268.1 stage II sporulation protein M [Nitrososphaera viennensis]